MERATIKAMLNYPDALLVDMAIRRANLTEPEWRAIWSREFGGMTVEKAAEYYDISPGTIKNEYRSGMKKLDTCWSGIPWISKIADGIPQ